MQRVWVLIIGLVVVYISTFVACGGNDDTTPTCASDIMCGSGCCPSTDELCVDPASGSAGCKPLCTTGSDCSTQCCAPFQDTAGNLVGPYICQGSDVCCTINPCAGSSCCVMDNNANQFCAQPCTGSGTCGGSSVCEPYSFANTSCMGSEACGPASN
jgi:hypothetical protein